jgi:hypothetical protein
MVDIDGVISLFGFQPPAPTAGSFHWIDGIPHFLSSAAAEHLLALSSLFELVWASGWEEKANEYLPHLLGLPDALPFLRFERGAGRTGGTRSVNGHWKLDSIDTFAGGRALAWIDDAFDDSCHAWAHAREAPTLLVRTAPERGLTSREAKLLASWAETSFFAER